MHPKIKHRPLGEGVPVNRVKPLLLHDVTMAAAPANAVAQQRMTTTASASGPANHARHHVARQAQS